MTKTYNVKVGTRNRITVPFDCWMDTRKMPVLRLRMHGMEYKWKPGRGMTPDGSYRVTVDFPEGTFLKLTPNTKEHIIEVKKAGPYVH